MTAYIAEVIGTFLLVFLGTGTVVIAHGNTLIISLGFGGALFLVILLFARLSSAHVNPVVSLGAWIGGNLSTHDLPAYLIAQFLGAILGSGTLFFFIGGGPIGETTFAGSSLNAFLIETGLTFLFVFVIVGIAPRLSRTLWKALLIGGALFLIHLVAVPLTGAGVNPARSVAPVVIAADPLAAAELWVYVIGPLLGGVLAGIVGRIMTRRHV